MTERIALVGINYAPEMSGIAPYTTEVARYLASTGAQVFVATGVPHYPDWRVPSAYRWRLASDERDGEIILRRHRHFVPRKQTAYGRALYEVTFGLNVFARAAPFRPTVVVGVIPSLMGAVAAFDLARRAGARRVLWTQDMMMAAASQSGIPAGNRLAQLAGVLERRVVRAADAVISVSEGFRPRLNALGMPDERIALVHNWVRVGKARGLRSDTRRAMGWGADEIIVLHTGNIGFKQALENVVEAARIADASAKRVRFVVMGDGSRRDFHAEQATTIDCLDFLPFVDETRYADVLVAADILLINERRTAMTMSLPSKLTSYLSSGTPVVAAVPVDGTTAGIVRDSGAGLVVEPEAPQSLVRAILNFARDEHEMAKCGERGRAYAERHLLPSSALPRILDVLNGSGIHGSAT